MSNNTQENQFPGTDKLESPRYKIINTGSPRSLKKIDVKELHREEDSSPRTSQVDQEITTNDISSHFVLRGPSLNSNFQVDRESYIKKSLSRLSTIYSDETYPPQSMIDKVESSKSCPNFTIKVLKKS